MVHRFNIFLLSIILVIAQVITMNQALAAGLGGWTMSNPVAQGASVLYDGAKNVLINGKNVAKTSTALITPTATQVAKVLARGAAGYALSIAVEQLLGAVSWVLDPANNQIKYTVPNEPDCTANQCKTYYYIFKDQALYRSTRQAACSALVGSRYLSSSVTTSTYDSNTKTCKLFVYNQHVGYTAAVETGTNQNPEQAEREEKYLPLPTVAQKVISNAESGDTNAQAATTAAAADIVQEAEKDDAKARPIVNQLEANAKTETDADANTATGESKPNTETGGTDLALEFPTFCGWAPQVCEAAQVVISFPQTLTNWWETGKSKAESWAQSISEAWTSTKEWMNKEETPEKETVVDIDQTIPVVPNTSYFNWGAYCPFSPGSQTISLENTSAGIDYDLTSWCEFASDIRPFVLAAGALMSFLIAAGVVMGRDD